MKNSDRQGRPKGCLQEKRSLKPLGFKLLFSLKLKEHEQKAGSQGENSNQNRSACEEGSQQAADDRPGDKKSDQSEVDLGTVQGTGLFVR